METKILDNLSKNIEYLENLKELLELRTILVKTDFCKKNEYEKNEVEIVKMKTELEIEKIKFWLTEKRDSYKELLSEYVENLEFKNE